MVEITLVAGNDIIHDGYIFWKKKATTTTIRLQKGQTTEKLYSKMMMMMMRSGHGGWWCAVQRSEMRGKGRGYAMHDEERVGYR